MPKLCMATVVSADDYQYFIPMFCYTVHKAYPECGVRIFLRGKMNNDVRSALKLFRNGNHRIIENAFKDFPNRKSICNTLRHVLPPEEFAGYDYLYITDIDFLIFKHKPGLMQYFMKRFVSCGNNLPYCTHRGPSRVMAATRARTKIRRWSGMFSRLCDGTLMLKLPQWWKATEAARKKYRELIRTGMHDEFDKYKPAYYREYNEVLLYRICRASKLKTPKNMKKGKFLDGRSLHGEYRDLHLGDFKFPKRRNNYTRMTVLFKQENVKKFRALQKDPVWRKIESLCSKSVVVKRMLHYCRKHVKTRDPS